MAWGLAWVVVGVCCVLVQPAIGCVAGAYGAAILLSKKEGRANLALVLALVLSVLGCSVLTMLTEGWASGVDTLANTVLMAFVLVGVSVATASRKAASWICAIAAVAAGACLGIGALEAYLGGTTITETVSEIVQQLNGIQTSLSNRAQFATAVSMVSRYWPMAFVLMGCAWVACAYLGARLGLSSVGYKVEEVNTFSSFEVPLWMVGALLAGVVALVATRILAAWSEQLTFVGANVVMATRVAFAVQGLALVGWFMRRHRFSGLAQALVFVLALYVEMQFFVMSVIGLVDVWANFRHLPHGDEPSQSESAK